MARAIMVQGTSSNAGKSILVTALCRIFCQDGYRVAPFKAQNMALNSFVTESGGEIGRAQVLQAWACGLAPRVEMNPVLLKPRGNAESQVIVLGKPVGHMSARDYHLGKNLELLSSIAAAFEKLAREYDIIVLEGAGSPAEVNLKERDLANMRAAKMASAPVLLVADIDRGGAIASVVGTLELLPLEEREMVRGIIINKFRGDITLLKPALDFLEDRTGVPVLGVVPHMGDLQLPAEDSVCLEDAPIASKTAELDVAVILLPRISNFTDFDALSLEPGVAVRYVRGGAPLGTPDLIVIPGTKNTTEDLLYLYESGYAAAVKRAFEQGVPVLGICGGYQMLGKELVDEAGSESGIRQLPGLGLLDVKTVFLGEKQLLQSRGTVCGGGSLLAGAAGMEVEGYEIHMGRTFLGKGAAPFLAVTGGEGPRYDGAVSPSGLVIGTYFHGLLDNDGFRRHLINRLRERKGLGETGTPLASARQWVEAGLDRLAQTCRSCLDMKKIYGLLGISV